MAGPEIGEDFGKCFDESCVCFFTNRLSPKHPGVTDYSDADCEKGSPFPPSCAIWEAGKHPVTTQPTKHPVTTQPVNQPTTVASPSLAAQ